MRRFRLFSLSLTVAVALTLMSTVVSGTHVIDCDRDDPSPCVQMARGFPFPYVVDHPAFSPAGSADLIGAVSGLDILVAVNFWADVLFWWFGALLIALSITRPAQSNRGRDDGPTTNNWLTQAAAPREDSRVGAASGAPRLFAATTSGDAASGQSPLMTQAPKGPAFAAWARPKGRWANG